MLRAITEHEEFRAALSGTEIGFAHELLDVVTRLSDTSLAFSEPDTQRALDTTERLLRAAGAAQEAEAVAGVPHRVPAPGGGSAVQEG